MKTFVKISAAMFVLLLSVSLTFGQTFTLTGSQTSGSSANNAKLECQAVTFNKTVTLKTITGDNAGFWISNNGVVVNKYYVSNAPEAVGLVLKAGTYYVYPNLKPNQGKATVSLKFE